MIEVRNLTKLYGTNRSVDNLSFTIEPGIIYGFLGPNGAGKSTTMNIMTGCLAATSGTVTINGHDIYTDSIAAKKLIGYLPEIPPVYPDMTITEYLSFVAQAKGVKKNAIKQQIKDAMEVTKIGEYSHRLIANLSKGYRQRVGLAQAVIGSPEVVILDEPTVGLDPQQIVDIRDLIRDLGKKHTVILSSHILSEVRAVCQSLLIIARGRIVACDTLERLESMYAGNLSVQLLVRGGSQTLASFLDTVDFISDYSLGRPDAEGICTLKVVAGGCEDIRERLFFAFAGAGIPLLDMTTQKTNLEQVFLRLTSQTAAPDEPADTAKIPLIPAEAASSCAKETTERGISCEGDI